MARREVGDYSTLLGELIDEHCKRLEEDPQVNHAYSKN